VRLLTDEEGKAIEWSTWGAWGEKLEGGEESRFGYTGHQTEERTGLHYSVYRYLDQKTARWTQRDPIQFLSGTANLYRYIHNRPHPGSDPLGLAGELVPQAQSAVTRIADIIRVVGPSSIMLMSGGESGLVVLAANPVVTTLAASGLVAGGSYAAGSLIEPTVAPL